MSEYYTAQRSRGLYTPGASQPFKLSRSKLELFLECPRCFYLDRRLGVGRPPGFPFSLNSAVDALLKKEFDTHRAAGKSHPIIERYGVDAVPVHHDQLDEWRNNFKGVRFHHRPTNFIFFGAIDDLWQNSAGEYIVVDYKATSKNETIEALDKEWHGGYKRQMEMYQWLLRQNGYRVSSVGYFVYCNGITEKDAFGGTLEFEMTLIPHEGDDSWVEDTLVEAHACLEGDTIPDSSDACDHCAFVDAVHRHTGARSS